MIFNMVDVGALPAEPERFYSLVERFPGSKVHAFEVDAQLCHRLNAESPHPNIQYYAQALGSTTAEVTLFRTQHPMCSSIYRPIQRMIDLFEGLEPQTLVDAVLIQLCPLDDVANKLNLGPIDFIKIDAQGASLCILEGAAKILETSALAVLCEAELMPLYHGEPLIGKISHYMEEKGFRFVKMIGTEGRKMKDGGAMEVPLWTNVLFVKDPSHVLLTPQAAKKMATLLELYDIYGWTPYLNGLTGVENP